MLLKFTKDVGPSQCLEELRKGRKLGIIWERQVQNSVVGLLILKLIKNDDVI
jgi:hypothetical protein